MNMMVAWYMNQFKLGICFVHFKHFIDVFFRFIKSSILSFDDKMRTLDLGSEMLDDFLRITIKTTNAMFQIPSEFPLILVANSF